MEVRKLGADCSNRIAAGTLGLCRWSPKSLFTAFFVSTMSALGRIVIEIILLVRLGPF